MCLYAAPCNWNDKGTKKYKIHIPCLTRYTHECHAHQWVAFLNAFPVPERWFRQDSFPRGRCCHPIGSWRTLWVGIAYTMCMWFPCSLFPCSPMYNARLAVSFLLYLPNARIFVVSARALQRRTTDLDTFHEALYVSSVRTEYSLTYRKCKERLSRCAQSLATVFVRSVEVDKEIVGAMWCCEGSHSAISLLGVWYTRSDLGSRECQANVLSEFLWRLLRWK